MGYRAQLKLTERFDTITKLALSVLPLITVAHYLTISAANFYSTGTGMSNEGMTRVIMETIVGFLLIVVLVTLARDNH